MEEPVHRPLVGWQPLARRCVAALAPPSLGHLLLMEFLVALLTAGAVVWFLQSAWFCVISEAISRMPAQGAIRAGALNWPGDSAVKLAENHFLALVVDPSHGGAIRSPAHLQVEFGRRDVEIISMGGYVRIPYREEWLLIFNRTGLEPWWGAWRPALLATAAVLAISGLMSVWTLLATVYFLPVWLAGFMANRQVTLGGSWRLAGAALMPGAVVMMGAMLAYGLGALDLVQLALAGAGHILLGWFCLIAGVVSLPRRDTAPANPSAEPARPPDSDEGISTAPPERQR